jgi:hypothetical protein
MEPVKCRNDQGVLAAGAPPAPAPLPAADIAVLAAWALLGAALARRFFRWQP